MRHETDHAKERARERGIGMEERKHALQKPCRIERDGDTHLYMNDCSRKKVSVVAVLVVGVGTAVVSGAIAGLAAGTFCSIVTWMLKRK